jgi:hypothetical protein
LGARIAIAADNSKLQRGRMNSRAVSVVWVSMLFVGCASDSGGSSSGLRCDYEVSSTGCNDSSYGAFASKCLSVDNPKDGLTPSGWCALATGDTSECAGGCCKKYKFRNAVGSTGTCP